MDLTPIIRSNSKKGQALAALPNLVILFGVAVIVMTIIATVLTQFQSTQTVGEADYNVTGSGLTGIIQMSNFNTVLAIVIIASVILALVGGFFVLTRQR